jgi:HPt (histidine-containing phosphotransfer) domain-containing protein
VTSIECSTGPLYSTLGTDPELAEIVAMFVEEMPGRIANFLSLFDHGPTEELRRAAHQLKGAAGSYGFETITVAAARLEDAIKTSKPQTEVRQTLDALVDLCQRAQVGP